MARGRRRRRRRGRANDGARARFAARGALAATRKTNAAPAVLPTSMNALYNHGIKQTQLLTKDLAAFETNLSTSPLSLQGSITTSLAAFRKTVKEYGDLVHQNNSPDDANAKHEQRLQKFQQDLQDFAAKFDTLKSHRETMQHEANKQELLGRRQHHAGQLTAPSDNPFDQPPLQQQQRQELTQQEGLYNERTSILRGQQQLDQILEMGQATFEDIVEQNDVLRKLGAKFEELLITLGVSQGTIKRIEKRAKRDKWLFWGCVSAMFVAFWYILKIFR